MWKPTVDADAFGIDVAAPVVPVRCDKFCYFGGGGTNTVVQQPNLPGYVQTAQQSNLAQASNIANTPYPLYNQARIAGFTPQQQQSMADVSLQQGSYLPSLDAAQGTYGGLIQNPFATTAASQLPTYNTGGTTFPQSVGTTPGASTSGLTAAGLQNFSAGIGAQTSPGQAAPGQASASNPGINNYMSPYLQSVLDPTIAAINQQAGVQQQTLNAQATQAGAFGGTRQDVAQGLQNQATDNSIASATGNILNQGYTTALGAMNQEQSAQLAGANALLGSGSLGQTEGYNDVSALSNSGTQQQSLNQQNLSLAYQDFLNQFNYPTSGVAGQGGLNLENATLSASQLPTGSTTTSPGANTTAQTIGGIGSVAGGLGSLYSSGALSGIAGLFGAGGIGGALGSGLSASALAALTATAGETAGGLGALAGTAAGLAAM